ncbi:MAG: N-acetyltransferase [Candidatus Azobacteroides sp.]|nr:N-acetyltransferase [Candidatus Azobacteroides sp.]
MEKKVTHNEESRRFEVYTDNMIAYLTYSLEGNNMIIPHTYVPRALEGQGIASAMVKEALEYARKNNFRVVPLCFFVRVYMERHPEYKI